jgi:CO/xanthine dehydrogenase FAD-binding subunit
VLLPRFEYWRAASLLQATTLLEENPAARALAGGTDLMVAMRERRQAPSLLVDISELA